MWLFRSRRQAALILGGSIGALALGAVLLDRALEAALRAPVDAYLRKRTLVLAHAGASPGLTIDLPVLRLSLLRRRLDLHDVRIRFDQRTGGEVLHFEADAPVLVLTGLDLSDLIWRRGLRLSGVAIDRPAIRRRREVPPDTTPPRPGAEPGDTLPITLTSPDSLLFRLVAAWLPDAVRGARVDRVRVTGATVQSEEVRGSAVSRDSTAGLALELRGLQLDTASHRVFERGTLEARRFVHASEHPQDSLVLSAVAVTVTPDDTTFDIGELRTGRTAGGHQLRAVGVRRSHARQVLTVDSLTYVPAGGDSTFFAAARSRATRVRLAATGLQATGLRQQNLRHRQITAGGVWIARVELDLLADRRPPPGPGRARRLWPARLAALPWTVGADSIVLATGTIRYAELMAGRPLPGSVHFTQVHARIHGLGNDSASAGTPVRIRAAAKLFGTGPLATDIEVPIQRGPIRLHARGELGELPLDSFNSFLLPGNGIEITSGMLQAAQFEFSIAGGHARGELRAGYAGLELRLVDKVTGRQNFGKKLTSMVAGTMVRQERLPDKQGQLKPTPIRYEQAPGDTFFGLLWRALRSGIVRAVRN